MKDLLTYIYFFYLEMHSLTTQPAIIGSQLTIETLGKGVKYVQSLLLTLKTPEWRY